MKGFLQCHGINHGNTHDLSIILEFVEREHTPQESTVASIYNLSRYDQRLRYKNLKTDPTPDDARATIEDVKMVLDEFAKHPKCAGFVSEAKEVHAKVLKDINK